MDPTAVGVIGSGNVGRALAGGFASRGHDVMIGSRSPDKPELRGWLEGEGEDVRALDGRPALPGGPQNMFIAGDDEAAKATVTDVLESFGWPVVYDIGGIEGARELDSLC